ncbi:MAG TPA: tetratricopeptide repeat protein [Syntrophales bacterium]|jgi:Tfp pilus assembly protein PilF|nr:tetratricopeptide repeat protein [Syntrophales bacterium]HON23225.1 tetratricopeptide repeat protein [Syntrophales bacterium]HOU76971.1 tetratricopeptide repeat protein [Syntrophales bacterium]HPC32251.1 tetratricopeptide repeat protein [Syntrophales bacterium]HQG34845.1 tetratricopeptide repeat protein [Syntrophales bacterium]
MITPGDSSGKPKIRFPFLALLVGLTVLALLAACTTGAQKRRERAESHLNLGSAYVEAGDYTAALKELLAAEKNNPDNPRIHYYLAIAYYGKGHNELAAAAAEKAVRLKKDYSTAYNLLGTIYYSQGKYDLAIQAFNKALADVLYETPALSLYNLGKAYSRRGDYLKALEKYQEAGTKDTRRELIPLIEMETGKVKLAQGDSEAAVFHLKKATELAPVLVEAYYWLGESYQKQRKNREARQAYETVIRLSPQSEFGTKARKALPLLET